jgi:hypothetical protein
MITWMGPPSGPDIPPARRCGGVLGGRAPGTCRKAPTVAPASRQTRIASNGAGSGPPPIGRRPGADLQASAKSRLWFSAGEG